MGEFSEKILLATDGSEDAALATRAAVDLSSGTGAELHVVHVWRDALVPSYLSSPAIIPSSWYKERAGDLLENEIERVGALGGENAEAHLRMGRPVEEILSLADEVGADLIVVGGRGAGALERLATGSVSEGVVHHASCPVLVLRGEQEAWPPVRVVIGDDGSEAAQRAGELTAAVGKIFGIRGLLVCAYPKPLAVAEEERVANPRQVNDELRRAERALQQRAADLEGALGSRPRARVAVGDAAAVIVEAAREDGPALVAVGRRDWGWRAGYGSVASPPKSSGRREVRS